MGVSYCQWMQQLFCQLPKASLFVLIGLIVVDLGTTFTVEPFILQIGEVMVMIHATTIVFTQPQCYGCGWAVIVAAIWMNMMCVWYAWGGGGGDSEMMCNGDDCPLRTHCIIIFLFINSSIIRSVSPSYYPSDRRCLVSIDLSSIDLIKNTHTEESI